MSVLEPTGESPTFPRSAVRGAGVFVVARVRADGGEVVLMTEPVRYDPDRLLSGPECARLVGVTAAGWRSLVSKGYAPAADVPDLDRPANRRMPLWKASTVAQFRRSRPGRTGRPRKEKPSGD